MTSTADERFLRTEADETRPRRTAPRVGVWRTRWLPAGETFVRNHVDSLRRWRAVPFGVKREASVLASPDDVILYSPGERLRRSLFEATGWSPRVSRFLRKTRFDLVHAHSGLDAVVIAPICRRLGLPLVVTLHGQDVTSAVRRGGPAGFVYRWRLRRTLRQARAVLAVSRHIADRARALGCEDVEEHVLGVPLPPETDLGAEPERDVLFAGRLVDKKGVFDLLRALARLREREAPVRAAIAGDGPLADDLRRCARGEDVDVDFLGFRPADEVRQLMAKSALVAVPSKEAPDGDSEGLPTVVMEAAAHARPVVGYRHSGVAEAVDHGVTGLLGAEGDVDELSRHLESLLRDRALLQRLGAAARRKAEAEFDIAARTRVLESIYDRVIAR